MLQRTSETDGPVKRRGGRGSGGHVGGGAVEALLKTSSSEQGSALSGELVSRRTAVPTVVSSGVPEMGQFGPDCVEQLLSPLCMRCWKAGLQGDAFWGILRACAHQAPHHVGVCDAALGGTACAD